MATPDKNSPDLLLRRAVMWLGLLADAADVEPAETTITVSVADGGSVLGETTLAADIAAIEALTKTKALTLSDMDSVTYREAN